MMKILNVNPFKDKKSKKRKKKKKKFNVAEVVREVYG